MKWRRSKLPLRKSAQQAHVFGWVIIGISGLLQRVFTVAPKYTRSSTGKPIAKAPQFLTRLRGTDVSWVQSSQFAFLRGAAGPHSYPANPGKSQPDIRASISPNAP